jgi:hypothetical protein
MQNARILDDNDDRFSAVEAVSPQIFERMQVIQSPQDSTDIVQPSHENYIIDSPEGALYRISSYLRDAMLNERRGDRPAVFSAANVPPGWVLVRAEDLGNLPLVAVPLPQRVSAAAGTVLDHVETPRIGDSGPAHCETAQRSQDRRDKAEPLEGRRPSDVSEEIMMESIRKLMVEQKREFNRQTFPELEPATPTEDPDPEICEDLEVEVEVVHRNRVHAALVDFVRKDTVLATALSIWASLFLMVFIEPELSQALSIVSLVLLAVFRIMHSKDTARRRIARVKSPFRRRKDPALQEALLTQV